jgi:hypothetical protein
VDIDSTALDALEEQEARLTRQIENFRTRVTLLEEQREKAERKEAAERLQEIVALGERLVEAREPALAAYEAARSALIGIVKAIAGLYQQDSELISELIFWVEKFALPRPPLPRLGERPDLVGDLTTELAGVFSSLSTTRQSSPWVQKRQQLQTHPELRWHPPQESKSVQPSAPTPVRETVSVPIKPDHTGDDKPNQLQELLRA